jgi:release factor glutamine methyltransferase
MSLRAEDTIADSLRVAAEDLHGASDDPRREAEVLLAEVLGCDRAYFFAYGDRSIDNAASDLFQLYVSRRKKGEPVAYIIGKREFWSLLLSVNDSTLIPRPDTELLVESALEYCKLDVANIIDLGTGTGAIALALASERPGWQIDAVDANANAVDLAKLNASQLALDNVHIYQSHWFASVPIESSVADSFFDLVISNPPYIAVADPHLSRGDVRFEPHTALVSGDDGYADLFHIACEARSFLRDSGFLLLEHGFEQADRVRNYLQALGYFDVHTIKDYSGNERVSVAHWHSKRE